jgi:hypothetical protein
MRKQICASLVACLVVCGASAQNAGPLLICKRVATDACGGGGSGGTITVPTLLPLTAYGSAQWTYSPPNDGINLVSFGYHIPDVSRMIWGGVCGKVPTEKVAVVVSNQDLYSTITATSTVPSSSIVSSSTMSYSNANPLSKSLSSTVETLAQPNTYWTIVVKEGVWGSVKGGVTLKDWSRNASVCKLYVGVPTIYVPPTTLQ